MECYHCGKTLVYGRSHTHHRGVAGGRWKKRAPKTRRIFKPNLQKVTILLGNVKKQVRLCMKCLKRVKKDRNEGVKPFLTFANNSVLIKNQNAKVSFDNLKSSTPRSLKLEEIPSKVEEQLKIKKY